MRNTGANNGSNAGIGVIDILSLFLTLQNMELNITANDLQEASSSILDDLHEHLDSLDKHLAEQDDLLKSQREILQMQHDKIRRLEKILYDNGYYGR